MSGSHASGMVWYKPFRAVWLARVLVRPVGNRKVRQALAFGEGATARRSFLDKRMLAVLNLPKIVTQKILDYFE